MNNKKIVFLMTPITKRWLRNHVEQEVFTNAEGKELTFPKVIGTLEQQVKPYEGVAIQLQQFRLKNQNELGSNQVRQFIQNVTRRGNKIYIKLALRYESNGQKVICSLHGYVPNRVNQPENVEN